MKINIYMKATIYAHDTIEVPDNATEDEIEAAKSEAITDLNIDLDDLNVDGCHTYNYYHGIYEIKKDEIPSYLAEQLGMEVKR